MEDQITKVKSLIQRPIQELGYELIDVSIHKEEAYEGKRALDVVINKEGGVSIDDCVKVSRTISPILDEHDPIKEPYILEVSSAGIQTED